MQRVVDQDIAAFGAHIGGIKVETLDIAGPTHGQHDRFGVERAVLTLMRVMQPQASRRLLKALHPADPGQCLDSMLPQTVTQRLGDRLVLARYQPRRHLEQRHVRAEG